MGGNNSHTRKPAVTSVSVSSLAHLLGKNMPRCSLQLLLRLSLFVHVFKLYFILQNRKIAILFKEINYKSICFIREEKNPKAKICSKQCPSRHWILVTGLYFLIFTLLYFTNILRE